MDEVVVELLDHVDGAHPLAARDAPARVAEPARSLHEALKGATGASADAARSLEQRIITDPLLRSEANRDQNVYLGGLYTRVLTRAAPDVIFVPLSVAEVQAALRWGRQKRVPITIRGAASTAMGGAVPNNGGLCLDLSRLEQIDVDAEDGVCVIGGGVRLRDLHRELAAHDLALPVYPSNLGATFAGWFVTGGVGYNAFSPGQALDIVRVAELVLPNGDVIRLHADGRLDVPADGRGHRELPRDLTEAWFRERELPVFTLKDLAGSEGRLGVVVRLVLAVGRRPSVGALLLRFDRGEDAFAAVEAIRAGAQRGRPRPANLKLFYQTYLDHVRKVWADDDRAWRRLPSELSGQAHMPWRRLVGPAELGVPAELAATAESAAEQAVYVAVDFRDLAAARAFTQVIPSLPGHPRVLFEESVRLSADRFRPQASKRFGPGLLAAEVDLPATEVPGYLAAAFAQARRGGLALDPEVYYTANGRALVIAGYLTDHRRLSFNVDLLMAPALLDLAIRGYGGRPYVIGRWQAPFARHRLGKPGLERLRKLCAALDPDDLVNRGVLLGFRLRKPLGPVISTVYAPGVRLMRGMWGSNALAPLARLARRLLAPLPGPGAGRGEPAGAPAPAPAARALHCVNCGECNDVCPVYDATAVRLPQALTHGAELVHAGRPAPAGLGSLLDLCMRCGSCEEVCQAGIPHLAMYEQMDAALRADGPEEPDRHAGLLGAVRGSSRYRSRFLEVRPGMYLRRSPAAQPGVVRFLVARAEAADGPAATCLHCGACVPVCPTGANHEFAQADARLITTDEHACIGCGVCVEVCPANRRNGGQTLRVMAAPSAGWERMFDDLHGVDLAAEEGSGGDGRRALWEDVLTLVADPESPRVREPERARTLLARLLAQAGVDEQEFWSLDRGRRSHRFLSRWTRTARDLPDLELSAFDIEKLLKERFRREPLTIGAAWHHGYWRAYFSHAAITHPANDGLREEFSTAWDIVRKKPAVVQRGRGGREIAGLRSLRVDMPLVVGPLPLSDDAVMELAYLRAIAAADEEHDRKTRTLVVVEADRFLANAAALMPFAEHLMVRLAPEHLGSVSAAGGPLATLLRAARIIEIDAADPVALAAWAGTANAPEALALAVDAVRRENAELLVSVALRFAPRAPRPGAAGAASPAAATNAVTEAADDPVFWDLLAVAARTDHVALVHYHSGPRKSYRLTPRIDAFLKEHLLRARVQLLSAGGDTDTHASAATVYEAVLLGANAGAMTHAAAVPLAPEIIEVLGGGDAAPAAAARVAAALASADPDELTELASCTLTCWQHSVLDFLSCMGIDDVQKTSGNTMAITMTEDWVREVDALATAEFGRRNAELNRERLAAEPVPPAVRERYKVSTLLLERRPELPLVNAARVLAQRDASYHAGNSSRALTADFLEVIYRMAAGQMPRLDDFFIAGVQGDWSLDGVGIKLSRESVAWSLERLARDPGLLDYVSLAVPRGFLRPGAVASGARVTVHAAPDRPALARFLADGEGGFSVRFPDGHAVAGALTAEAAGGGADQLDGVTDRGAHGAAAPSLWLRAVDPDNGEQQIELRAVGHGAHGATVVRASADGAVILRRDPRGGLVLSGLGVREPIWHGPVCHASTSLGAASEDFLVARVEGNAGITMTSSGEGGAIRPAGDADWRWESLQAASGHFGITGADLRRVRDVEIKINQGAKPGKGGRLSGAKVTSTVSRARNIPVGTDALSPDPKHDIYSIEDMPAEVWLWLMYHNYCGIKITGSNYTKYVAAGMWSNFVVDYLLIDAGTGGSGNYHADSSHVGWPDIFRTILHTHHALLEERVDLDGSGRLRPLRDLNGAPFGAAGGTRLLASGGLRGEMDMVKVLIAGADALVEGSIGKAVAFGCNQCGNCHLDCPRGGITTKQELTVQNDRDLMRARSRNWAVLNLVKLAVLVDALNRESGALDEHGEVADPQALIDDIRSLRGRTDLLEMPAHGRRPAAAGAAAAAAPPAGQAGQAAAGADAGTPAAEAAPPSFPAGGASPAGRTPAAEHDSCRVGSLAVSEPVTVHAIWEAAKVSFNGGNNRGGGIDWAGFAPAAVADATCVVINTIGPDRDETMRRVLEHFRGCRFLAADGSAVPREAVADRLAEFRLPVRAAYGGEEGWRAAGLRESPGDFYLFFVELEPQVLSRYGRALLAGPHWLQARTKYGDVPVAELTAVLEDPSGVLTAAAADFREDVRQEYFTVLAHIIDSRYYRTHGAPGAPAGKFSDKRRAHVVSIGEDLAAVKLSGWTHVIPEYFDFDRFWAGYPGAAEHNDLISPELRAHVWGMHHRYPTNSPAIDAEGRGNPAGAHPFKAYNVLLMHNGEQVGVDSTSPFLREYGYVHTDPSMGDGVEVYDGDSVYDRKALTDTEYAAYLVDFTRRVLGLSTEEASQIISPITGLDLEEMPDDRRDLFRLLSTNYVQLTPTGPYKFTIVESRGRGAHRRVGFRENMDIKFLRPHELAVSRDTAPNGVEAVANGSEAKIADAMLRTLHGQGVLADAGHDLRFSMRPGGDPGRGEFGGVVEAFVPPASLRAAGPATDTEAPVGDRGDAAARDPVKAAARSQAAVPRIDLRNRFGEPVKVERAGVKTRLDRPLSPDDVYPGWRAFVDGKLEELAAALPQALAAAPAGRFLGPEDELPGAGRELVEGTLERLRDLGGADYRYLVEQALPAFALWQHDTAPAASNAHNAPPDDSRRAAALRVLAELRKRAVFADLGGKALSSIDYLTDGGRDAQGRPEGGIVRVLDAVPPLHEALAAGSEAAAVGTPASGTAAGSGSGAAAGRWGRLTLATRDDLLPPCDPARDVLVVDFAGFTSESFGTDCAARFVAEAVRAGWRTLIGYGCSGGPRYIGSNLTDAAGAPAEGVVVELFGRECGDFLGALLEGAQIWLYGQGQCHIGMKAGSGSIFVLQDGLNTCCYAAHGGKLSIWDSGSRFAVAGQNRVHGDDDALAQGFTSIHFGSPNEYAFEYLMSGGENSLHVVLGLAKPDHRGELALRARPYAGKFFMSGAAAGRVFVFDPLRALHPQQYHGNTVEPIAEAVWREQLGPFIAAEAGLRGAPIKVDGDEIAVRLQGEWRRWHYQDAFIQLVPLKVARKAAKAGAVPPQLEQIVDE